MNRINKYFFYCILYALQIVTIKSLNLSVTYATSNSGSVTITQTAVKKIINNIGNKKFLPYPYNQLKYDIGSSSYILVSKTPTYTLFNVQNNFTDKNNNPIATAATYDASGNLLTVIQGACLTSLLAQYGIVINESGKQSLGVAGLQPSMQLNISDKALSPGQSGISMIHAGSAGFPSLAITSPVTYGKIKFYFYYNTIMQSYFIMQVNGNSIYYINMVNGCTYNLDGSNKATENPVGILTNSTTNNFFLPYLNNDGYLQCLMQYHAAGNTYSDFSNTENNFQSNATDPKSHQNALANTLVGLSSPYNSVTVYQMPIPTTPIPPMPDLSLITTYNVYWNSTTPTSYTISPEYTWQNLQILPIDMTSRNLLNPMPSSTYTRAAIILKSNVIYAVIFAGQFFIATQKGNNNSYILTSGSNQITMSIQVDSVTQVKYISFVAESTTYNYQLPFTPLSTTAQQNYQTHAWLVGQITDALGNVLLVKNLPMSNAGNVQLTPVSISSIQNIPTDPTALNALNNNIESIAQDTVNQRFLTMVYPTGGSQTPSYSYLTQNCYADLATGILFTTQGLLTGATLQLSDLNALTAQLQLSVVKNGNVTFLSYTGLTTTLSSTNQTLTPQSTNTSTSTTQTTPIITNPQIIALQQENTSLQIQINQLQTTIQTLKAKNKPHDPNVLDALTINQHKIMINTQQITDNNKQISALQKQQDSLPVTGSYKSNVIGRLNSKKLNVKKNL